MAPQKYYGSCPVVAPSSPLPPPPTPSSLPSPSPHLLLLFLRLFLFPPSSFCSIIIVLICT